MTVTRRAVNISRRFIRNADELWAVVRDFCAPWHPAVATMIAEHHGHIRRFTVIGEDTVYRERLSYFSDTDRTMTYTHLEGIAGLEHYSATLSIKQTADACEVLWSADILAEEPRATQIAEGTAHIFGLGLDSLASLKAGVNNYPAPSRSITSEPFSHPITGGIALTSAGAPSKYLCLFLHGIGGNRSNWQEQLRCTAPYMQAAAMDLRGYGGSARGSNQTTIDDYCNDILQVMKFFGASRLVLCGMSLGSWIATSFAMRYPEQLAGLVLTGGCTGMSEASPAERENFLESRQAPLDQGKSPRDFADAVVNLIASPNAPELVRKTLFNAMAALPATTYRDALWCFTHPNEQFDFSRIICPVLMMTGEHDRLAPPHEIRSVARRIHSAAQSADVRFEVIEGAGHICNIENHLKFNDQLADFVQRLAP